jgi:type II secretory pathway component PulM
MFILARYVGHRLALFHTKSEERDKPILLGVTTLLLLVIIYDVVVVVIYLITQDHEVHLLRSPDR